MRSQYHRLIALLRGINVGGHNKIPMAELRSLCAQDGWGNVQSYIQSGNLLFTTPQSAVTAEDRLERSIKQHFGLSIPVIVRSPRDWSAYIRGNPFPAASAIEPNLVMLGLSKLQPAPGAEEGLRRYAVNGERVVQRDNAIWIHFPNGSGRSKISPAVLDRTMGSVVTSRNWRTVSKLEEMMAANA